MSGWGSGGGGGSGWGSKPSGSGGGGGGWGTGAGTGTGGGTSSGGGWGSGGGTTSGSGGGGGGWGTSGSGSTGGGWGASNSNNQNNNQQQQQNPYTIPGQNRAAVGSSTSAAFLAKLDAGYNAAHKECHFRAFLNNMCPTGQSHPCTEREKARFRSYGGGPSTEAWTAAERDLPAVDRDSYYPTPVHFAFALQERQGKQQEQIKAFHTFLNTLGAKQRAVKESQEKNEARLRKLVANEGLLERKLLLAMCRAEVLRRSGIRISSTEEHEILQHVAAVRRAVGKSASAALDSSASAALASALQQYSSNGSNGAELYKAAQSVEDRIRSLRQSFETQSTESGGIGVPDRLVADLGKIVGAPMLRDWARLLDSREDAIQKLQAVVQKDLRDLQAVRGN